MIGTIHMTVVSKPGYSTLPEAYEEYYHFPTREDSFISLFC